MIRREGYHLGVVSTRRPAQVPAMTALVGPATWYVRDLADREAYTRAGADHVVIAGGLVAARNRHLDDARLTDHVAIQLSDDLVKLAVLAPTGQGAVPAPWAEVAHQLLLAMPDPQAPAPPYLAGVAPTANAGWAKHRVNPRAFIVGDLIAVHPRTPLRFDPGYRLKEDYDYTCQHLHHHGRVARLDWVLATFRHRKNPGGAVDYRTPEREAAAIARLLAKWPEAIRPNPRRPGEVLLRWPAPARA